LFALVNKKTDKDENMKISMLLTLLFIAIINVNCSEHHSIPGEDEQSLKSTVNQVMNLSFDDFLHSVAQLDQSYDINEFIVKSPLSSATEEKYVFEVTDKIKNCKYTFKNLQSEFIPLSASDLTQSLDCDSTTKVIEEKVLPHSILQILLENDNLFSEIVENGIYQMVSESKKDGSRVFYTVSLSYISENIKKCTTKIKLTDDPDYTQAVVDPDPSKTCEDYKNETSPEDTTKDPDKETTNPDENPSNNPEETPSENPNDNPGTNPNDNNNPNPNPNPGDQNNDNDSTHPDKDSHKDSHKDCKDKKHKTNCKQKHDPSHCKNKKCQNPKCKEKNKPCKKEPVIKEKKPCKKEPVINKKKPCKKKPVVKKKKPCNKKPAVDKKKPCKTQPVKDKKPCKKTKHDKNKPCHVTKKAK
jgi:hypothetical protein